tara:strand:- start:256 stop:606 length:351 start_codon:yes stop_codon:yes gene_type:complete
MKKVFLAICFILFLSNVNSQEWVIVDIVSQTSKELVIMIDVGSEEIERKKIKNPSIVSLINEYQSNGFVLEKVTSGIELDMNGSFPLNSSNRANNFGITSMTLSNNNRIMLWFKKE